MILHVSTTDEAKALVVDWTAQADKLANLIWPGPLTMVLKAASHIPAIVTAGLSTVALRCPSAPLAQALIKAAGVPIAAPSANSSGKPSPTKAEHVLEDMNGKIALVIDGGQCGIGIESTIVDMSVDPPTVLRPGGVTIERLREILGVVDDGAVQSPDSSVSAPEQQAPKAPGMKYRHYAPAAPVTLLEGRPAAIAQFVTSELTRLEGVTTGLLLSEETWTTLSAFGIHIADGSHLKLCDGYLHIGCSKQHTRFYCRDMGRRSEPLFMAHALYDALRACDAEAVSRVYVEACYDKAEGAAVLNRLRKAAENTVYCDRKK